MKAFDKREVLAGIIVLLVGILIGSFWLSDVAKPVQAISATLGSISTACTLVFLIIQNRIILRRQDSKDEEDRRIRRIEYIKINKELFYNFLSELEDFFIFNNKKQLYSSIFKSNTIEINNENSDIYNPSKAFFEKIESNLNKLKQHLEEFSKDKNNKSAVRKISHTISILNNLFHVQPKDHSNIYQVITNEPCFNSFKVNTHIHNIITVANNLSEYCGLEETYRYDEIHIDEETLEFLHAKLISVLLFVDYSDTDYTYTNYANYQFHVVYFFEIYNITYLKVKYGYENTKVYIKDNTAEMSVDHTISSHFLNIEAFENLIKSKENVYELLHNEVLYISMILETNKLNLTKEIRTDFTSLLNKIERYILSNKESEEFMKSLETYKLAEKQ